MSNKLKLIETASIKGVEVVEIGKIGHYRLMEEAKESSENRRIYFVDSQNNVHDSFLSLSVSCGHSVGAADISVENKG